MHDFLLCFVPLFVAVDAIAVLPIFIGLTESLDSARVKKVVVQSILTASVVGLGFLIGGAAILRQLNITVSDFMVAGGVLLFLISLSEVVGDRKHQQNLDIDSFGAVPLGVPLIAGPAVLTTLILLHDQKFPLVISATAFILNILIAGAALFSAKKIVGFLGKAGSKTVSKVAALLLAAFAVMMVRKGLVELLTTSK